MRLYKSAPTEKISDFTENTPLSASGEIVVVR